MHWGLHAHVVEYVEKSWRLDALNWERGQAMDTLAEKLDARLREWKPDTAAEARERISEVIDLADNDVLDVARSRAAEQDVLDMLDEPPAR
jgi:hypothetical protein